MFALFVKKKKKNKKKIFKMHFQRCLIQLLYWDSRFERSERPRRHNKGFIGLLAYLSISLYSSLSNFLIANGLY